MNEALLEGYKRLTPAEREELHRLIRKMQGGAEGRAKRPAKGPYWIWEANNEEERP